MEHSWAYKMLIEQVNATGYERKDGYYRNTMEKIYDWERDEVEEIIWETFHKNMDTELAIFLPKLKNYDGIDALKKMFDKCNTLGYRDLNIAGVLYKETKDVKYLNVFREIIEADEENFPIVAKLLYLLPDEEVYKLLKEIYINSNNDIARGIAVNGILHSKGIIKNIYDLKEKQEKIEIKRRFDLEEKSQREKIIKELEEGKISFE
jgi:hypothetical protein